jgi:hypothetical protein
MCTAGSCEQAVVENLAGNLGAAIKAADAAFQRLLRLSPHSSSIMRQYAHFLLEVCDSVRQRMTSTSALKRFALLCFHRISKSSPHINKRTDCPPASDRDCHIFVA